jgi:hypothetical protein
MPQDARDRGKSRAEARDKAREDTHFQVAWFRCGKHSSARWPRLLRRSRTNYLALISHAYPHSYAAQPASRSERPLGYHLVSRCVPSAWLRGKLDSRYVEHRKRSIEERTLQLARRLGRGRRMRRRLTRNWRFRISKCLSPSLCEPQQHQPSPQRCGGSRQRRHNDQQR